MNNLYFTVEISLFINDSVLLGFQSFYKYLDCQFDDTVAGTGA